MRSQVPAPPLGRLGDDSWIGKQEKADCPRAEHTCAQDGLSGTEHEVPLEAAATVLICQS